jgi:hypothetical protein
MCTKGVDVATKRAAKGSRLGFCLAERTGFLKGESLLDCGYSLMVTMTKKEWSQFMFLWLKKGSFIRRHTSISWC